MKTRRAAASLQIYPPQMNNEGTCSVSSSYSFPPHTPGTIQLVLVSRSEPPCPGGVEGAGAVLPGADSYRGGRGAGRGVPPPGHAPRQAAPPVCRHLRLLPRRRPGPRQHLLLPGGGPAGGGRGGVPGPVHSPILSIIISSGICSHRDSVHIHITT